MSRHSSLAPFGAILVFALAAAAPLAPAAAAANDTFFRAELASPLAEPRQEILSGVVWRCEGTSCTGTKNGSRPVIVCERLAQKVGPITAFAHPKGRLDEQDLARCNGQ